MEVLKEPISLGCPVTRYRPNSENPSVNAISSVTWFLFLPLAISCRALRANDVKFRSLAATPMLWNLKSLKKGCEGFQAWQLIQRACPLNKSHPRFAASDIALWSP